MCAGYNILQLIEVQLKVFVVLSSTTLLYGPVSQV